MRVKLLQVLGDERVRRRAPAWPALLARPFMAAVLMVAAFMAVAFMAVAFMAVAFMAVVPAAATESADPAASVVPEMVEARPGLLAVADVRLESGWLLVDEENGTERLVPEPPPVGSAEILYTGRFRHLGAEPATGLRIEIPVPEGVHYVAGSATGPGAVVTYSVDGVVFAPAGELDLPVTEEPRQEDLQEDLQDDLQQDLQSPPRRATAEDYAFIRWDLPGEFPPGAAGLVSFRARPMVDESAPEDAP
ncbi:hypothetical protein [Wenzhouxiangella sp. XN24]|uniref:hypothetical protein n=1 Tax=Wenzhouxiangella sp. XN24 TaxID=2713569 RepID=UPI0013EDDFA0|nr:hypothetical protein [Wenzhouxiangella sp. XN24]NGX16824.1 hypothetical protein [Wenzhouxiangella sp. XN24]